MGQDRDLPVALPSPPPPRPAARREAIDAAQRKFDGIEEPARPRARRRFAWANIHRRPAGALAAVAAVAILGIPAIQIAIRDTPPPATEEAATPDRIAPGRAAPGPESIDRSPVAPETASPPAAEGVADEVPPPPAQHVEPSSTAAEDRALTPGREEKARTAPAPSIAPAAPTMAAPPPPAPPPPPPPPAEPQAEAEASGYDRIVVTGSRINRPNMESASPVAVIDSTDDFLPKLRGALQSNDRRALLGLIALPLKVNFDGEVRTYRTRRDVARDYDRIFTPEVRRSATNLHPAALTIRDGGRLRGNGRLWFGCGKRSCARNEAIRIREIHP